MPVIGPGLHHREPRGCADETERVDIHIYEHWETIAYQNQAFFEKTKRKKQTKNTSTVLGL